MMTHVHHIIPRHMGGTDDPSNLVRVSVEEHAELHLALYLEHGLLEDWCAYHMLSGKTEEGERARVELSRRVCLGGGHLNEETRKKMSEAKKGKKQSPELIAKRFAWVKGSTKSEEHKEKIRQSVKATRWWKKKFIVTHQDGTEEIVDGIRPYCEVKGYNRTSFSRFANGKIKSYRTLISIREHL